MIFFTIYLLLGCLLVKISNITNMSWCHIYYITSVILYIYSGYVAASEYYVSAGATCPYINAPCHNLSYYTAYYRSYFTDNTVFYFLEGTHTLQDTLKIINVSNITLQGLGNIKQSFHKTVMQSTSVIICNYSSNIGIKFSSNRDIVLKSLTIANCGGFYSRIQTNVSLLFVDVNIVTLEWVSVHNGSGFGLVLVNAFDMLIMNSSFTKNQPLDTCTDCLGGNAYILYYNQATNKRLYNVSIIQSNFTFGLNRKGCTRRKGNYIIQSSGGLSISLMNTQSYKIEFIIESVVFYNNIANVGANFLFFSVNTGLYSLIMNNTISTYGKALISSTDNYDCTFGAGMTVLQLYTSNNEPDLIIENCIFADNFAQQFGGGVVISWLGSPGNIKFNNCTIYNNKAYHGSGLILYGLDSPLLRFHIRDVSFDSNKVLKKVDRLQSAVLLVYIDNVTFEQIEVSNHDTTGLLSYNSQLTFYKNSNFVNNSGTLGGGMALYDSSHLILKEQTNVSFVNNYASESGGGIFVSETIIARDFPTYCFFKFEDDHSTNATLYFFNNKAEISGDVLYGGNVDYCLNAHEFFDFFNYTQQIGLSVVSSDPIEVCFCQQGVTNCSVTNINITAMPGINLKLSLATVGSKNGLTKGVIKLTGLDSSFKVQTVNTRLNSNCTDVTFSITTNSSLNTTRVYVTLEKSFLPLYDPLGKVIEVTFQSCPFAFPLDITNNACACIPELEKTPTITCDVNTQTITRHGEMWIGYNNNYNCVIVHQNCPFDYCSDDNLSFTFNTTKKQCLHNRSGLLCGQCAEGLSLMLGSNQCGQCTYDHLALIIPFGLAGIALVAFIIGLNLTVSVGTINGLIFYANVVKIYEHIFFSNGPLNFYSHFISWLNLDLGIETCFIIGIGSCSKVWLQFFFPGYVWFLLILIIILSRYSSKVVRLVGRQAIPVLATMILLSYTKLIRTVFQVLHHINIKCTDKNFVKFYLPRWYIDATVEYLKGCHLPLFLFSLAVLILLIVPYTFYLLTIPLFEGPLSNHMFCCQKLSTYMKPFSDAYGGPYKDKCRFWTGFLLLVRVVLALVVSQDTEIDISLDVLASILVVIIFIYFPLRGVYKQLSLAYLELFFILNLILLSCINKQTFINSKGQVSTKILVSFAFVVFCGVLFYHIWDRFLKSCLQDHIRKMFKIQSNIPAKDDNKIDLQTISSTDSITYSVVPELREPLLDDQNDILFTK